MNKRDIGKHYEETAAIYLKQNGIIITDRNVYCGKVGEIDIIGIDRSTKYGDTLVFFEIKYRKNGVHGRPEEAINSKKRNKLKRCAEYYLAYKKIKYYVRFDVIAIEGEEIRWHKNVF